jgi:hypothetical protein
MALGRSRSLIEPFHDKGLYKQIKPERVRRSFEEKWRKAHERGDRPSDKHAIKRVTITNHDKLSTTHDEIQSTETIEFGFHTRSVSLVLTC